MHQSFFLYISHRKTALHLHVVRYAGAVPSYNNLSLHPERLKFGIKVIKLMIMTDIKLVQEFFKIVIETVIFFQIQIQDNLLHAKSFRHWEDQKG